jgi:hypothetical protein
MPAVVHAKSDTINDATGTVTFWDGATTASEIATNLVRPSDWNSGHNQLVTITGNTLGSSTMSGTNIVYGASNGISLSASTAAGAATVWFVGDEVVGTDGFNPYPDMEFVTSTIGNGSLIFDPEEFPLFQMDRVVIPIYNTNATNSSGSHTITQRVGLYTRNGSTLSLFGSTSQTFAIVHSGTLGIYSSVSGLRLMTIPWTTTFNEGVYWIGYVSSTSSAGAAGTYSNLVLSNLATTFAGMFSAATNATVQYTLGQGFYSVTTNGIPSSVAFSQIQGSHSNANRMQPIMFASGTV